FMKTVVPRLREMCDHDVRHSDPPATHIAKGNAILYNKRLLGTYGDGGWIWGQVRICTPMVASHCDLLVERDTAEYVFDLPRNCRKGLKSAELVMRGAVAPDVSEKAMQTGEEYDSEDDKRRYTKGAELPFKFNIDANGHVKRNVTCSWIRGRRQMGKGTFFQPRDDHVAAKLPHTLLGKSDWTVKLKKDWIKPRTKVKLTLLSDGLVMYEKITLKLNY
ncbi:hypothetical protein ACFL1X_09735, partial [Candidatus Hydrogenedentota bacterium]